MASTFLTRVSMVLRRLTFCFFRQRLTEWWGLSQWLQRGGVSFFFFQLFTPLLFSPSEVDLTEWSVEDIFDTLIQLLLFIAALQTALDPSLYLTSDLRLKWEVTKLNVEGKEAVRAATSMSSILILPSTQILLREVLMVSICIRWSLIPSFSGVDSAINIWR